MTKFTIFPCVLYGWLRRAGGAFAQWPCPGWGHFICAARAAASGRIRRAPRAAVTSPPWPTLPNRGSLHYGVSSTIEGIWPENRRKLTMHQLNLELVAARHDALLSDIVRPKKRPRVDDDDAAN